MCCYILLECISKYRSLLFVLIITANIFYHYYLILPVIITSKQRKGQRCLTKSQTKKTKDSVSQAAVGAPTSDADSDGHPTDQVDEGKTPVRKSRYTLFVGINLELIIQTGVVSDCL